MDAFLTSLAVVAIAEFGDKTQLLALALGARFRAPLTVTAGILAATIVNHALAGAAGVWLAGLLGPQGLRWALGLSFLAMAVWVLIPDRLDAEDSAPASRASAFMTTLVAFFLAEMGDKTQIATVALAARFGEPVPVILGTTLGLMAADVPALWLGARFSASPKALVWVHRGAALLFLGLGVLTLVAVDGG